MRVHVLMTVVSLSIAARVLAQGREGPGSVFDRADTNGDGAITRDEFRDARAAQFTKRDRNHDGAIDQEDVGQRAAARPRVTQAMNALLTQFDSNADSEVSKDEFVDGGMKVFERADADGNGTLDAKEVETAKAKLRERAGGGRRD